MVRHHDAGGSAAGRVLDVLRDVQLTFMCSLRQKGGEEYEDKNPECTYRKD